MPWCPSCKTEYRFGITNCTDCGSLLVEEAPSEFDYVLLTEMEETKEEVLNKLLSFLEAEAITDVKVEFEENAPFKLLVPENQLKRAEKIVAVFKKIEAEKEFSSLSEEEKQKKLQDSQKKSEKALNTHVYTSAEDRYKENVSTAWTFLVLGILGLGFTFLNIAGILNVMAGILQYIVATILFFAFIVTGILSFKRNSHLKEAIQTEADHKKRYENWFLSLPLSEFQTVLHEGASNEENEILLVNHISERLVAEFPEINENFADSLADEFFNRIRDKFMK